CAEVLLQLRLVSRTDEYRGNGRPLQQPVQRDLRYGLSRFPGDDVQCIDDAVQPFLVDRRREAGGVVQAAGLGQRLPAADLAREAAPAQWTPHHRADALVEPKWHQLPLVVAAD